MKPFDKFLVGCLIACAIYAAQTNTPAPDPNNPTPVTKGWRILITHSPEKDSEYILKSKASPAWQCDAVRDQLEDLALLADGTKAVRFYQENQDISKEDQIWQDMMKRPRSDPSWIYADKGLKHISKAFPMEEEKALAFLKKEFGVASDEGITDN